MQSGWSEGALCDVMHHTVSEVIPEVKGVQAFPPVFFNNKPINRKEKIMGLDIYLTKKTFIGAMFRSSEVGGTISLTKRGKPIPIKAERLAYVEEDIFHGRKITLTKKAQLQRTY